MRAQKLLALLVCPPALAEEARDITDLCKITVSPGAYHVERITDRDWSTPNLTEKQRNPVIEVTMPGDSPLFGVYVCKLRAKQAAPGIQAR